MHKHLHIYVRIFKCTYMYRINPAPPAPVAASAPPAGVVACTIP